MAEAITLVHVNSADLYKTGHMASRWFGSVSRQLSTNVRAAAPKRVGTLKAGIHSSVRSVPQARTMDLTLTSEAPHTMAVLRGTIEPTKDMPNNLGTLSPKGRLQWITSTTPGKWMTLPPGGGHPARHQMHVAGQRKNNFLSRGWRKTAIRHGVMRPTPSFVRNP